jgi:hypothetical protein
VDPLRPSTELLLKLAAIVACADRYVSPAGAMKDLVALEHLLLDAEVIGWQIACESIANSK